MSGDAFRLSADRVMRGMSIIGGVTRSYLRGVRVEPLEAGGALLIATDGCMMLIQHDTQAVAPRAATLFLIDVDQSRDEDWEEHWSRDWEGTELVVPGTVSAGTVAAPCYWRGSADPCTHMLASEVDGKYPDWRVAQTSAGGSPIIPGKTEYESYLPMVLIAQFAEFWRGARLHYLSGPDGPVHLTFEDDPHALAVVMPRRVPVRADPLPGLLQMIGRGDLSNLAMAGKSDG